MKASDAYKVMFTNFPDVVSVDQMCQMLGGISKKTAYQLLKDKKIKSFFVGRSYLMNFGDNLKKIRKKNKNFYYKNKFNDIRIIKNYYGDDNAIVMERNNL